MLRVLDDRGDSLHPIRHLWHGRITHGTQLLRDEERNITTTYYADGSGVEIALRQLRDNDVAVRWLASIADTDAR